MVDVAWAEEDEVASSVVPASVGSGGDDVDADGWDVVVLVEKLVLCVPVDGKQCFIVDKVKNEKMDLK